MKNKRLLLVQTILIIFILTPLVHAGGAYFYDGNKLVQHMKEWEKGEEHDKDGSFFQSGTYLGYVIGVFDASTYLFGPTVNVTAGQICAIVAKYLKANPEKWNEPASDLIIKALKEAFPLNKE